MGDGAFETKITQRKPQIISFHQKTSSNEKKNQYVTSDSHQSKINYKGLIRKRNYSLIVV